MFLTGMDDYFLPTYRNNIFKYYSDLLFFSRSFSPYENYLNSNICLFLIFEHFNQTIISFDYKI